LKLVDDAIWGVRQQTIYHHQRFFLVVELKTAIVKAWQIPGGAVVYQQSVGEWRRRLQCVVRQNGGHEHVCLLDM